MFSFYGNTWLLLTSLKACHWSGHIFGAIASPIASPRSLTKKVALSPSSTVHGGQHDTKYVAFELLLHAAFVADEIWGDMLEPACTAVVGHRIVHRIDGFSFLSQAQFLGVE